MPFGEELDPDGTYRTADQKYGVTDNVQQKFTGYQRDIETDLDFAEARYYNNGHGRFTAVDPLLTSGKSADPQTFNRYAYTMNRPLILTDESGLQAGQDKDVVKVDTQLSTNAPRIYDVKVTSNGKEVRDDLFVGDRFTISYKARINRADEGQDPTKIGRIEGVERSQRTYNDGRVTGEKTESTEGRNSFADVEGAKRVGEQVVDKIGTKKDETEVEFSQEFEITGRKDGTPRGSNQINFQIVVTDPRAPLTENRNNSNLKKI
jgi:RHS repeat-associated protein